MSDFLSKPYVRMQWAANRLSIKYWVYHIMHRSFHQSKIVRRLSDAPFEETKQGRGFFHGLVRCNGFWVIQAIRNLMAWTGIKRSFPSLSKTSKTRKSLIKSAFSTQSTKSTSNSSPPRLSAARYPIWGAGGMLEGCKQDIPPANSYRGHTH